MMNNNLPPLTIPSAVAHRPRFSLLGCPAIALSALFLTSWLARADGGEVVLDNSGGGSINAPVFDVDGLTPLEGADYLAVLYAGPSQTSLESIGAPIPFLTGAAAGYFNRSADPDSGLRALPTVSPGHLAYVQVRGWEAAAGPT